MLPSWIFKVIGSYHLMSWLIPISSQLRHVQYYWHGQETPCEASNAEFTSFINFSCRIPEAQSSMANNNQVVFPSWTWGFIPNCLDLSIYSKKSLIVYPQLLVGECCPFIFSGNIRGSWVDMPRWTTTKLGSYQLNKSWLNWATKKKKKQPYFPWNTELFE